MRAPMVLSIAAGVACLVLMSPASRSAEIVSEERVVSPDRVADSVALRDVHAEDGVVRGVVVNRSGKTVRDVQLLVRHEWLWRNEFRPGDADPGRAVVQTIEGPIAPGGELPFTYAATPPLPERADGRFRTSVDVVALVEVTQ